MVTSGFLNGGSANRCRFVRIAVAAAILKRDPRTVRYYAKLGRLRSIRGKVWEEDVYRLKEQLELYYRQPFKARSRRKVAS